MTFRMSVCSVIKEKTHLSGSENGEARILITVLLFYVCDFVSCSLSNH